MRKNLGIMTAALAVLACSPAISQDNRPERSRHDENYWGYKRRPDEFLWDNREPMTERDWERCRVAYVKRSQKDRDRNSAMKAFRAQGFTGKQARKALKKLTKREVSA